MTHASQSVTLPPHQQAVLAPYENPCPSAFEMDDAYALRMHAWLASLEFRLGCAAPRAANVETFQSPALLWISNASRAKRLQALLKSATFAPPQDSKTEIGGKPHLVAPPFPEPHQDAADLAIFLTHADLLTNLSTVRRYCQTLLASLEHAWRYRPQDRCPTPLERPELDAAERRYAAIGANDRPWSILDFNFLPALQLQEDRASQALHFEPNGFVQTQNKMGYMTSCLDPFSNAFVCHGLDYPNATLPALEIGAAFGVATLPALNTGKHVVANDISASHLAVLTKLVPPEQAAQLTTRVAHFPDELDFSDESFSAILVSRILHFLTIPQLLNGLQKVERWLAPGGHLFIVEDSPYLGNTASFIPEYEARCAAGHPYPGMRDNITSVRTSRADTLPDLFHFFDRATLERVVKEAGLEVINCCMFPRLDYPADVQLDGREGVGLIARKPR